MRIILTISDEMIYDEENKGGLLSVCFYEYSSFRLASRRL